VKTYKAKVTEGDNGWLVAEITGVRAAGIKGKSGIVTQGRDLNELAWMIQDAVRTLTLTDDFAIQLTLTAVSKPKTRRAQAVRRRAA